MWNTWGNEKAPPPTPLPPKRIFYPLPCPATTWGKEERDEDGTGNGWRWTSQEDHALSAQVICRLMVGMKMLLAELLTFGSYYGYDGYNLYYLSIS